MLALAMWGTITALGSCARPGFMAGSSSKTSRPGVEGVEWGWGEGESHPAADAGVPTCPATRPTQPQTQGPKPSAPKPQPAARTRAEVGVLLHVRHEGGLVDARPARGVDKDRVLLHHGEPLGVDEMARVGVKVAVQRHDLWGWGVAGGWGGWGLGFNPARGVGGGSGGGQPWSTHRLEGPETMAPSAACGIQPSPLFQPDRPPRQPPALTSASLSTSSTVSTRRTATGASPEWRSSSPYLLRGGGVKMRRGRAGE
jgi:hypothetical protein